MPALSANDPRAYLVQQKYFCVRPQPLEQWLWDQRVPASAERVFWIHWQEGHRRGDWCSEIPIKRVAQISRLDISTVTRAYQELHRLGLIRRTDPGRDANNPFQQAVAVTEVRVPRELLTELDRYPNRRPAASNPTVETMDFTHSSTPQSTPAPEIPRDPLEGYGGRQRLRAISRLTAQMDAAEQSAFHEATRMRKSHMEFAADTRVGPQDRAIVLQLLTRLAAQPAAEASASTQMALAPKAPDASSQPRKVPPFEIARLRREIQLTAGVAPTNELTRQVIWSVEQGALRRFNPLHAIRIALKKIREGGWSRPNRMPPNWMPTTSG